MVRVWDGPTRLFHWLLVASVAVAMLTGFLAPEWWMGTHLFAGYAIVLLLIFRLVWGIFGSEYARLINLARSTRYLGEYVRGVALLRPPHYVGHNPVGALMIFAFFGVFLGLVATGLMVQAGEEKQGYRQLRGRPCCEGGA
jgi:cytochrome b